MRDRRQARGVSNTVNADKKGKKILLTGGSGTLGYNILRQLANDPRYCVAAPMRDIHSPVVQKFAGQIQFIEHDLSDAIHTAQIFERLNPDIIVHCAASGLRPPKGSWFDLMQFNVVSTMRLFQMNCRLDKDSHFIYISTGLVYREQGRPWQAARNQYRQPGRARRRVGDGDNLISQCIRSIKRSAVGSHH